MQYTLDKTNVLGELGKGGTSVYALEFLCKWLNENGKNKGMNIFTTSINMEHHSTEKINGCSPYILLLFLFAQNFDNSPLFHGFY